MFHDYVVYGPVVFSVNTLEKQFVAWEVRAHYLSQMSWTLHSEKKWHKLWPNGLEV